MKDFRRSRRSHRHRGQMGHMTGDGQGRVLPAAGKAETENDRAVADPRLASVVGFDLLHHLHRPVFARARWQLDVGDGVALVFLNSRPMPTSSTP